MEVWKDIKGYEGIYQVSSHGRIKSLDRFSRYKGKEDKNRIERGKLKKYTVTEKGYLKTTLFKNGKGTTREIQRIVAETFIENPMNKTQVNHIDGIKTNNHVENLEWVTPKENSVHRAKILHHGIKAVSQYDLNGNYIRTFKSLVEAEQMTGTRRCSISNVVCGRRKKAGNFLWKLEE